jgi:putative PIN family toxin of toxin-antitoxin system
VLVSALIADGPPSRVLEEVADSRIDLVLPEFVLAELERVLTDKLGFELERVRAARGLLERLAVTLPQQPAQVEAVTGDPDDDVILACAVESQAGVLATGDRKHLLPLREHRGLRLLTPQALLAELRAS